MRGGSKLEQGNCGFSCFNSLKLVSSFSAGRAINTNLVPVYFLYKLTFELILCLEE